MSNEPKPQSGALQKKVTRSFRCPLAQLTPLTKIFPFLKLSMVGILSVVTSQAKKIILGETLSFQISL